MQRCGSQWQCLWLYLEKTLGFVRSCVDFETIREISPGCFEMNRLFGFALSGMIAIATPAWGQIVPDETLRQERSRVTSFTSKTDLIEGGATRGINLFHSFQDFNVSEGRNVYFISPNANILNIFARVTGSNPSQILGTLGTASLNDDRLGIANANLFLMNPNGIVFGKDASLEVDRSFFATTANAIQFSDRGIFSASRPQGVADVLSIDPSAFLFSQLPGDITVRSNAPISSGSSFLGLRVPNGQNLTLLGGNVNIEGGRLNAFGGRVEIGAISGTGAIALATNGSLNVPENVDRADVQLKGARIDVALDQKGDVNITARNLNVSQRSGLIAGIEKDLGASGNQAGNFIINATGEVRIEGLSLVGNVVAQNAIGNGGNIEITTGSLVISDESQLNAITLGQGSAGKIIINARDLISLSGKSANGEFSSGIYSTVERNAEGIGGDIQITTNVLDLSNAQVSASTRGRGNAGKISIKANQATFSKADVISRVEGDGVGKGGNIQITANSLDLSNGAQLTANTRGRGDAGNVVLNVRDRVSFNDSSAAFSNVATNAVGKGGNVEISTRFLEIANSAQLVAGTDGQGDSGDVVINADRVSIAGGVAFNAVGVNSIGKGGDLRITTNSLDLSNGAQLNTNTSGRGNAGNVVIKARDQILFDNGDIFSSVDTQGIGNAGNIQIFTPFLTLINGAQLSASTFGQGTAGNILIDANRIFFSGTTADGEFRSGALSTVGASGIGKGGNIQIKTGTLDISNGAALIASTFGQGDAGNVVINARDLVSLAGTSADGGFQSGIFSTVETSKKGNGGNIQIFTNRLNVSDGGVVSASTMGRGDAGSIEITARDRVSFTGTTATGNPSAAFSSVGEDAVGQGGDIRIAARVLELSNGAQFIAGTFSNEGNAGTIRITASGSVSLSGVNPISALSTGLYTNTLSDKLGGDIVIDAPNLRLSDGAALVAGTTSSGTSGSILINTRTLALLSGATLYAATTGSGRAGNITITAADRIDILGIDSTFEARRAIFSQIPKVIDPPGANSGIFVSSRGLGGAAGSITLTAPYLRLSQGIVSAQSATVDGGNIDIRASDRLLLRNNSQISTTAGTNQAGGNGGNINIDARFIIAIPKENSDITANAFQGSGGKITISTQGGILGLESRTQFTPLSDITASSEVGISGTVTVNAPDTNSLQNSLTQLSQTAIDTNTLITDSCIARNLQSGSFYITGLGKLPTNPGEISTYSTGTVQSVSASAWKLGDAITEPQGVYQLPTGELILSRACP